MFLFTEEAAYLFSCNPPIACHLTAGNVLMAGCGLLLCSPLRLNDVIELLQQDFMHVLVVPATAVFRRLNHIIQVCALVQNFNYSLCNNR